MKTRKIITTVVASIAFTLTALAQSTPSYVPTDGLVGYWGFNGNANDESGNGNNGIVNGATLTTDRNGNVNSAYSFSSAGCSTRIDASINTSSIQNSFTLAFWLMRSDNGCGSPRIMEFWSGSDSNGTLGFAFHGNSFVPGLDYFTSTTHIASIGYNQVNNNQWAHIVFTCDANSAKCYQDGVLINTFPSNGNAILAGNAAFGRMNHPANDAFNGKLDDIAIYNRALTQQEITNLYNSSLPQTTCLPAYVPTNGLVGYWPFCGNANDESGNGNNGTVNGATLTTDRFGNANKAYDFNSNNNNYIQTAIGIHDTLTFSAWFKCGVPTKYYGMIYSYGDSSATGSTYSGQIMGPHPNWVSAGHVGKFHSYAFNNSYLTEIIPTQYSDDNNWHNVIITYIPNDKIYFYYDGVFISNTPLNAFPIIQGIVTFGRDLNNNAGATSNQGKFDGTLDDIGIWNRALTQAEITQLYTATPTPTEVAIGTQTWTTKNLDVATYTDGTVIPQVTDPTEWANLTTGAWCYYDNDPANGTTYGKLYNFYAVAGIWNEASKTDTTQRKKLAPTGYHVPSYEELTILIDHLGGGSIAGGKMKETGTVHWASPNQGATNSSGFSGLPGGNLGAYADRLPFNDIGYDSQYWCSTEVDELNAWIYGGLNYYDEFVLLRPIGIKNYGVSVRCVKDISSKPTASAQTFCGAATVANLTATGTDLKWYPTETDETVLAPSEALITHTYYVSQTIAGTESPRTAVAVTVTPATSGISVTNGLLLPTVTIGTQTWTTKNLDVATYSDGTVIPQVQDATAWANLTTGAWCYYNNDPANGAVYGKLYNWYAVAGIHDNDPNTPNKKLAPTGYHVQSDDEWNTLTDYLGGASVAGGRMKETGTTHWASPNTNATNTNNFAALPGGFRYHYGPFGGIGYSGHWWSSSETNTSDSYNRQLDYVHGEAFSGNNLKGYGFSVRCLRD